MLDLVGNQQGPAVNLTVLCRRHCAGPERAEEGVRTQCLEKKEYGTAILPRGVFELGLESVDIGLLRATFVLLTLSSCP